MAKRSDGMEKRERLLETALEVFARKGFHDATVAEICKKARANVASINYYFGGKEALYAEVQGRLSVHVLCPNVVATNIISSDRNRPGRFGKPGEVPEQIAAARAEIQKRFLEMGMPPSRARACRA